MYESPIQMISEDIIKDIVKKQDGVLLEAVHRVGFDVNKEELEKALLYDRNQWERGYVDGKMDGYHLRDTEIVRCKECKHYEWADNRAFGMPTKYCSWTGFEDVDDNDFCSRGERREDDTLH